MRNLLAFTAALLLTILGVGWYLDWYRLGTAPALDGHRKVTIDINTAKISEDVHKAEEGLQHKLADGPSAQPNAKPAPAETNQSRKQEPPDRGAAKPKPIDTEKFFEPSNLDKFIQR
jgi:hypothetical protein